MTSKRMRRRSFDGPPRAARDAAHRSARWTLRRRSRLVTEEIVAADGRTWRRHRERRTSAWPAGWPSTAWPTAASCTRGPVRATSGSSRRRATPAEQLSASLSFIWHQFPREPAHSEAPTASGLAPRPRLHRHRDPGIPRFEGRRIPPTTPTSRPVRVRRAQNWPNGRWIGWLQGRMEFGPRAAGGTRSILGEPAAARCSR